MASDNPIHSPHAIKPNPVVVLEHVSILYESDKVGERIPAPNVVDFVFGKGNGKDRMYHNWLRIWNYDARNWHGKSKDSICRRRFGMAQIQMDEGFGNIRSRGAVVFNCVLYWGVNCTRNQVKGSINFHSEPPPLLLHVPRSLFLHLMQLSLHQPSLPAHGLPLAKHDDGLASNRSQRPAQENYLQDTNYHESQIECPITPVRPVSFVWSYRHGGGSLLMLMECSALSVRCPLPGSSWDSV